MVAKFFHCVDLCFSSKELACRVSFMHLSNLILIPVIALHTFLLRPYKPNSYFLIYILNNCLGRFLLLFLTPLLTDS